MIKVHNMRGFSFDILLFESKALNDVERSYDTLKQVPVELLRDKELRIRMLECLLLECKGWVGAGATNPDYSDFDDDIPF